MTTIDGEFERGFAVDIEVRAEGDGRTVCGILVPYDKPQFIHSGLTEQFDRSAFDHQLAAMHRVQYYWGHRKQGGKLVGRITVARPDAQGLYGEMRVSKTQAGDEMLELVKDGALPHLSVGFRSRQGDSVIRKGVTHRVKADLFEIASVDQGAYGDQAAISAVRSTADGMTVDEARRLLRDLPILF